MTTAWRIVKAKYKKTAFTGQGSQFASGRWHHQMVPVVYCSDSLALAAFEQFVHLMEDGRQIKFVFFELHIPADLVVKVEDIAVIPKRWRTQPPGAGTKNIGSDWYRSSVSAVLSIPSVLVPHGRNYLLNPHHADLNKIEIADPVPFGFDPRMWK